MAGGGQTGAQAQPVQYQNATPTTRMAQPQGGNIYAQAANGLQSANTLAGRSAAGSVPMASAAMTSAATYNPAQIGNTAMMQGATYKPAMMGAAPQLANTNLAPYMNPYTSQVINTSVADMNRARQGVQNQNGAAASAAGAFGGSRHGIVEAETNRGYLDEVGQLSANLRQAGYQNAQQAALTDIGNRMNVNAANQAAANTSRQYNAGNTQQARGANMAAQNATRQFNATSANQAGQFNAANRQNTGQFNAAAKNATSQFNANQFMADRELDMSAADRLANYANLGFGMGQQINSGMMQQGAMQQALQQSLIDAAKGQFSGQTGAPQQSLAQILAAISGSPGNNMTSSTTSQKPGLLQYLTPLLFGL